MMGEGNYMNIEWKPWDDSYFNKGINDEQYEFLKKEIVRLGIRNGGFWHQREGVPVFEDGNAFACSMRSWGGFMAEVWSEQDGKEYDYIDFAWEE
jgi:hypothetical protein